MHFVSLKLNISISMDNFIKILNSVHYIVYYLIMQIYIFLIIVKAFLNFTTIYKLFLRKMKYN